MTGTGTHSRTNTALLVLAFAAIYLIWGSTFFAIRVAIASIPPLLMMAARHLSAGALLFVYMRMRGEVAPPWRMWGPALVAGGFCFLGSHGLLAWSEQRVSSGLAALLVSLEPVIMVLLAHWMKQEGRVSGRTLAGLALGIAGVAVLVPIHATGQMIGVAALLLGGIFWSVGAIYARGAAGSGVSSGMYAAMQMLSGGVLLLLVGTAAGERVQISTITMRSLMAVAYLSIFGSVIAFSAYTWLMRVSTAARVGTHAYVNPIIAVWLGWAFGAEVVTGRMLLGAAIILVSVFFVNQAERGKKLTLGPEEPPVEAEAAAD